MSLVFQFPEEAKVITPFESFPVTIRLGSSLAVLFSDGLSQTLFLSYLEAALLKEGPVYHIEVGRSSIPPVEKVIEKTDQFYFAKTVRFHDILSALKEIPNDSSLVVDGFPLLRGISSEGILELVDTAGSRGITIVLSHSPLVLNELDLPGEFRGNFLIPEIFDYLLVIRTGSYRGHYRIGVSVLRAPFEEVYSLGEHSLPADALVKKLL
jgi:hypothetical protein